MNVWSKAARLLAQLLAAAPVRTWAVILAGPPMTAVDCWLCWILWRGGWPPALAGLQLQILGGLAFVHALIPLAIVLSLASMQVRAETRFGTVSIGGDEPDAPAPAAPRA